MTPGYCAVVGVLQLRMCSGGISSCFPIEFARGWSDQDRYIAMTPDDLEGLSRWSEKVCSTGYCLR